MILFADTELFRGARDIAGALKEHGHQAYFVGGAIRDTLMNKPVKDIDIVTSANPEEIRRIFPVTHDIGIAFGIVNVVENGINYEVATMREEFGYSDGRRPDGILHTDSPLVDAARRDFTVNAMFYDPFNNQLLDFFDGRGDLRRGVLRTVGNAETRFREDYLRMLRAVRFSARFGFRPEPELIAAATENRKFIGLIAAERIREELNGMLEGPDPAGAVTMLHRLGILEEILPEVSAMDGVGQHELYHPEGDVMEHTMLMLRHISWPCATLAWCILLHDIGKVTTRTVGDDGIPHFYGHEEAGALIAGQLLKRLRFSSRETAVIVGAIRNHMRFAHVDLMRPATRKRLMSQVNFPLELELHRIDCVSSNMLMGNYALLLDLLPELEAERALPPPLISGADLIGAGMRPGPRFGVILRRVRDEHLDGRISTREEALELANRIIHDEHDDRS